MTKVSVIIPVYGVEKYIEKCARSLFEQTLTDMEFIFIDDCSPDRSLEILQNVLDDYPHRKCQVLIHRMDQNSGLAAVRKWGIMNATGEYLIHCDSDDWMEIDMCETLYNRAIQANADLVFCDYYINTDAKESIFLRDQVNYNDKSNVFRYSLISYILNPVWGVLAKKSLYDKVKYPTGSQSEDQAFVIQLVYHSQKISKYKGPLYHYRLTPNSITHRVDLESIIKRYKQIEDNRFIIRDFSEDNGLIAKYPREYQAYYFQTKMILFPYLSDPTCRLLWNNSFPESNKGILFNPYVSIKEKLSFYVSKLFHKK